MARPDLARKLGVGALSAALLLAVVVVVPKNIGYRSLHPDTSTAELLSKATDSAKALSAKLESVDVNGALTSAVVQQLAGAMVKVPKGQKMKKSDVIKAAEDITKVLQSGKKDDALVKNVEHLSETHGGKDSGSASLFKKLHMEASAKKGKNGLSVAADVTSALDVSKARSAKQQKMARQEALAIAKVIEQSKEDLGVGKLIQQHSKSKGGTKDWDSMWESKHSLVSRLAAQVGLNGKAQAAHKQGTAAAAKQIKGQQAAAHKAVHAGADEHNKDVPLAIRKMWALLKANKK